LKYLEDGSDIKIGLGTVTYMDFANSKRCIESANLESPLSPDVWFWIDGPYSGFKFAKRDTPDKSDDGSREYLETIGKVILTDFKGPQPDKRNCYVKLAKDHYCDCLIIIDSDEYFHPGYRDWKSFRRALASTINRYDPDGIGDIFGLQIYISKDYVKGRNNLEKEIWKTYPRVWHRPENMEYYGGVHWYVRHIDKAIAEKDSVVKWNLKASIYEGIRMTTDSNLRDYNYLEARDRWASWQLAKENRITIRGLNVNSVDDAQLGIIDDRHAWFRPLILITQGRDLPLFLESVENELADYDKLWMKYFSSEDAYIKGRKEFLENKEYTHLIILSDDLIVTKKDIETLTKDIVEVGYSIISGWCNMGKYFPDLSNISIETVTFNHGKDWAIKDYKIANIAEL
jgi:hypothetical protein